MEQTLAERNKRLALKAFDTLFNRHDYDAAATMWSESYIQHSTHIGPVAKGSSSACGRFPRRFGTKMRSQSQTATMWFYTGASRATVNRAQ
jgi:predicted SnoaL-like aldol condensation-catalyzing enzyme